MKLSTLIYPAIIVILVLLNGYHAKQVQKRGVMDNFNEGLKYAGQMFGVNTAADVATLVAKAFSTTSNKGGKPDVFSLIQKGLQALPSKSPTTSSEENRSKENQKNHQSEESRRDHNYSQQQENDRSEETTSSSNKQQFGLNSSTANLVTSMLRMVGFDATKLGALALNVLIMVASTIGTTLLGNTKPQLSSPSRRHPSAAEHDHFDDGSKQRYGTPSDHYNAETGPEEHYSPTEHQPRALKDGTPIDWFLQNPSKKMKSLLDQSIDSNLPEKIIDMISNYETEEGQTGCLRMLMCKSSPIIWGMQKSLKQRINGEETSKEVENETDKRAFNVENFYTHMPSLDEFREHGSKCEKLHAKYCNTTELRRGKRH